jgi:general secretion pathway protein G
MNFRQNRRQTAFTLIELLIVVTILGILAAIIVPQFRTMSGDASAAALKTDLQRLRDAIERYTADHGNRPVVASIESQLTMFTDRDGATSSAKDDTYAYGPYLVSMPKLPVGAQVGQKDVTDDPDTAGFGWCYYEVDGRIHANTTDDEVDINGRKYNEY